jgi:KaiC/GvpD/RAD55 family RecA-like ATPase
MVKEELISRSPVRVLMASIQEGLAQGELGLIASPSGLGKTSVLVQIALDKLLQGLKVVHISFTKHSDHVLAWYEDLFEEMTKAKNVQNINDIKDDIAKNRVFLKFTQDGVSVAQIINTLKALIADGGFNARTIIVDGLDFTSADAARFETVRTFAKEHGLSFWYSCSSDNYNKHGIPAPVEAFEKSFDVIINLDSCADHIALKLVRNRENPIKAGELAKLDPRTLLLA